jgi:hypothetical protein
LPPEVCARVEWRRGNAADVLAACGVAGVPGRYYPVEGALIAISRRPRRYMLRTNRRRAR